MDLLQTGLVSPHPSYYLLCLAQTNSLLVCLFFGGGVIFSPTAKQDPVITCVCVCGWRDEGWRGRHAIRIDMSGQEKNSRHSENGRNEERSGFGDGEEEEGARATKNSFGR